MFEGYRFAILGIAGWLITSASPIDRPHKTGALPNSVAKHAPNAISAAQLRTANLATYQAPCLQPRDHEACDLEAQWRAAEAARNAADWGWWQMVFSGFGLAGLLYSLILTRRATKVAVDATKDADKALEIAAQNADAAKRQVAVSEDTARRRLRAYVRIDPGNGVVKPNQRIRIPINILNYGLTPARKVAFEACVFVRPSSWRWEDEPETSDSGVRTNIDLAPNLPFLTNMDMEEVLPASVFENIRSGKASVYGRGRVWYEDVFGESHYSTLRFDFSGEDQFQIGKLRFTDEGNIAT